MTIAIDQDYLNSSSKYSRRCGTAHGSGKAELEFIFVVCATLVGTLGTALGLKEAVIWTTLIRSLGIAGRSLATEAENTAARLHTLGQLFAASRLSIPRQGCTIQQPVSPKQYFQSVHLRQF
jgi:hypothetical protein